MCVYIYLCSAVWRSLSLLSYHTCVHDVRSFLLFFFLFCRAARVMLNFRQRIIIDKDVPRKYMAGRTPLAARVGVGYLAGHGLVLVGVGWCWLLSGAWTCVG